MGKLQQAEWLQLEQGEGEADGHEHPQSGSWYSAAFLHSPFYSACDANPWDSAIHIQGGSPLPSYTSVELLSWTCSGTRVTITGIVSTVLLMNNRQIRLYAEALLSYLISLMFSFSDICLSYCLSATRVISHLSWRDLIFWLATDRCQSIHSFGFYSHTWHC